MRDHELRSRLRAFLTDQALENDARLRAATEPVHDGTRNEFDIRLRVSMPREPTTEDLRQTVLRSIAQFQMLVAKTLQDAYPELWQRALGERREGA